MEKMKIVKLITISLIMMGMMIGSVNAAPSKAGYIDVQKVLLSYEKARKTQEQIIQKEQLLQDEISAKRNQAEKARNRGVSDAEVKNLLNQIEKDYEPKRAELNESRQKTEREIKNDISNAIGEVAKKMGIEEVINKQVLFYTTNFVDITDKVIELLNKKK